MDRWGARGLVDWKINNEWKSGFSANYSSSKITGAPGGNSGIMNVIYSAPSEYNLKGIPYHVPGKPTEQILFRSTNFNNPYWWAENDQYRQHTNRAFGNGGKAKLVTPGDKDDTKVMDGSLGYPAWYKGSLPIHLLSKAEIYFILAEAKLRQGQDATEPFKAAVKEALTEIMTFMGDDTSKADEFVEKLGKPDLKLLFEQKYLAQCIDEQVETYNDIRRCEAMGEKHITLTNPNNNQGGLNRVPKRLPYGNDSVLNNPKVSEAYGDGFYVYDQPVWWAGGTR